MSLTKVSNSMIAGAIVNVLDFGAVGNGVADDTAAVQAAINFCLTTDLGPGGRPTKNLAISGRCRITSSLIVNRQVDTGPANNFFTIYGESGGGFYTDTPGCVLFSTTLPYTGAPVSQLLRFENVQFEAASAVGLSTFVLDKNKFLRFTFQGCNFVGIRCLSSTVQSPAEYTQSTYFFNCDMRGVPGVFFESTAVAFDLKVIGCLMEGTSNGWNIVSSGCSFVGNCMEGMASGYTIKAIGNGLAVHGNYFEGSDIDLDLLGGANFGFSVVGNFFGGNTGTRFAIEWGATQACVSSGNYCTEKLHFFTTEFQVALNDFALVQLTNATNTTPIKGVLNVEDPQGYGLSRVFENQNNRKFTGQLVGSVFANTNFLQIGRSTDDCTIIIDLVVIGTQPTVSITSQMSRFVIVEDGTGVTITTVNAVNNGLTPVVASVSGNNIILSWIYAGAGGNSFNIAYEILGVAGAGGQNQITVTALI